MNHTFDDVIYKKAGFKEGQVNQRVVSRIHPSSDLAHPGWNPPVDIENQPWGPSAGWVVPLYAPSLRRVYAIYTYNEGEPAPCIPCVPCVRTIRIIHPPFGSILLVSFDYVWRSRDCQQAGRVLVIIPAILVVVLSAPPYCVLSCIY